MKMGKQDKKDVKKMLERYSKHEFVQKSDRARFKKLLDNL